MLKNIVSQGWYPLLITVLASVGYLYEWPVEALIPILVIILVIGLATTVISAREKEMERASLKIRELAGYFNRRFTGDSSLSIFAIIASLFKVDDPKLWQWARACDMAQRIFNTWCDSFTSRLESDARTGRLPSHLRLYLNELWLISSHYYEFVEQFYEVAEKIELPPETSEQYNKFVTEYNAFAQDFRDSISKLRKVAKTQIEPPSIQFARELAK